MTCSTTALQATSNGISFVLHEETGKRECFISKEVLDKLSSLKCMDTSDAEPIEIFQAFEVTISTAARRLIATGISGAPVLLRSDCFR